MPRRIVVGLVLLLALPLSGCGEGLFSASLLDPLGIARALLPNEKPVRIGLACEWGGLFDVRRWGKQAPWTPLARALSEELGRPVVIENLRPFQIRFHLTDSDRLQFALLGATDYAAIREDGAVGTVLAVSEVRWRQGVIVCNARSEIQSLGDLAGKRFAFGPEKDAVLHTATAALLEAAGVPPDKLATVLPGVREFHPSSRAVAGAVAYGLGVNAGVVQADEFDAYPETGGKWSPLRPTFSKDQFRVLARTPLSRAETMEEGPFLARDQADEVLAHKIREVLLSFGDARPEVLHSLGFSRFRAPPDDSGDPADSPPGTAAP